MSFSETLLLSFIEIISMLNIWGAINLKLRNKLDKKILVAILVSIIVAVLDQYTLKWSFIVFYLVFIITVKLVFEIPKKRVFFEFIVITVLLVIIQSAIAYILIWTRVNTEYSFMLGLKVNSLIFIISLFLNRKIRLEIFSNTYTDKDNAIVKLLLLLSLPVGVFLVIWQSKENIDINYFKPLLLYLVIGSSLGIYYIYNRFKLDQKKRELKTERIYTGTLKDMVTELRSVQHDHKNHLFTVQSMVNQKEYRKCEDYIDDLFEKTLKIDRSLSIGDPIISAIVYGKMARAKSKDIDFLMQFRGHSPAYPLKDYELVEVIGNILDNAIDANENYFEDNKKIVFTIGTENSRSFIEVKNTADISNLGDLDSIFEKGYSTKKGANRGYGLYNVSKIVKAYKGTIEVSIIDDLISLKILF